MGGSGKTQEDSCPQGSSSLLGSPSARSTYEDDRTTWPHCWCLQEEGRLIFKLNPLFSEKNVCICEEWLRNSARYPKRDICHLPSSFFVRELFLAFVSIFYVNSF